MSVYMGKSIDTFEDVWNMWMGYAGITDYIHADVLSFRCFAFSCGEDVTRWFSPVQPIHMAFAELCNNLGIREMCSVIPASMWDERLLDAERPVLLADICLDVGGGSAVKEKFYHGAPPFSLICRHTDRKHIVYASSGIPFVELPEGQVKDKILNSKGYIVTDKTPMQIRLPYAGEILHKGIRWREKNVGHGKGMGRFCLDKLERIQGRFSQISIQYGLMNYQVQLSKLVRFCAQEMRVPDSIIEELNSILLRIAPIGRNHLYGDIAQIDEDFWALIEKIEEKCIV